ncbi:MAG: hypothetical protein NC081_10225 [Roseburia sp.]|nr:hypothetical protein [Roseburia sp.]
MRGKKKILLSASCVIIVLLLLCAGVLCYGGKREIDQKILFIYRYHIIGGDSKYYDNYGYFVDNQGKQVEYDFSKQLDGWIGMFDDELLETLEGMEYTEGKPLFSAKETRKLYNWLYKIDAECEIERKYVNGVDAEYDLLGIRYKEDGTAEMIQIFETGGYSAENPDPYARKIKTALLQKNPIRNRTGGYYDK